MDEQIESKIELGKLSITPDTVSLSSASATQIIPAPAAAADAAAAAESAASGDVAAVPEAAAAAAFSISLEPAENENGSPASAPSAGAGAAAAAEEGDETPGVGAAAAAAPVAPLFEELSDEERARRIADATHAKNEGNKHFSRGEYEQGVTEYTQAITLAPFHESIAVFYANRAACYAKLNEQQKCIDDCTKALESKPDYTKVLLRRAQAREATDALEGALDDYKAVLQQDPRNVIALEACRRLPPKIEEQREKLKTEMFDKLRDLGNMVLRPFGLSTNNFNMVKDPNSGSYSVQFNK